MYGMGAKTYDSTDTPYAGTEDPLDLSKDTARQVWGGDWHMPTEEQIQELIDNTTRAWYTSVGPGVACVAFTGTNGNTILLSAGGFYTGGSQFGLNGACRYWTSTPKSDSSSLATYAAFESNRSFTTTSDRYLGHLVRPVIG